MTVLYLKQHKMCSIIRGLGPFVQSIVSLTSSLRGQLIQCFMTLFYTDIFFVEKNARGFCNAKASHIFQ